MFFISTMFSVIFDCIDTKIYDFSFKLCKHYATILQNSQYLDAT